MRVHQALFGLVLALGFGAMARDAADHWIDETQIPPLVIETGAEVRDRNGELLRAYQVEDGRWRLAVSNAQIDPAFFDYLIGYEDKRFLRHNGVDLRAAARAGWQRIRHGRIVSGASTLTMQTARLLEDGRTGTWSGKLRQTRLALALERRLSKQEILQLYANRAPYGGNLEGVRAATLAYFGKEPRRLTPAEIALLVALPQSPEARRPDVDPVSAQKARNLVLERLAANGVISGDTAQSASKTLVAGLRRDFPSLAPHLADRLRRNGPQAIQSSIDADKQRALEHLAERVVQPLDPQLSIAIVVADHQSGEVLASVGSSDYDNTAREGFVDMTRALRSPGSTLKPLIYGLGFEQGLIHPETLILDRPMRFGAYAPSNFDGGFQGELSIRHALQRSLNLPVIQVLDRLGPAQLTAAMRRAGTRPVLAGGQPGLAIGLGGMGVSLQDLVQLYAAIARGGQGVSLTEHLDMAHNAQSALFGPRAAWYLSDILKGITPPDGGADGRIAYKTGTSYGHRDALAVGFDGRHVIGIWMGRPDGTPVPGAFGADLAAPVLFEAFSRIKPELEPLPNAPRDALMVANAELPTPLQKFGGRGINKIDPNAPEIAFPPKGATLVQDGTQGVFIQIRNGAPPFTWLANGEPVQTRSFERQLNLPDPGRGYLDVTVIDTQGRSARTEVFVD